MNQQSWWPVTLALCLLAAVGLLRAERAWPQEPVGVVTALQGVAHLTRPALATPVALRFKDGLQVRDIVDTQEQSLVRILFGGKSTVTVRELSRLEVREETLPSGATLSIHELASGSILVNVARQLLRPGDEIQIRTPNAVAAVRGTTISAQCWPDLAQCIFIVLAGDAVITPLQGSPFTLTPNTSLTVTGHQGAPAQAGPVQSITPAQAAQVMQQYAVRPVVRDAANQEQTGQAQLQTATQLATVMASALGSEAMPTPVAPSTTTEPALPVTTAPVVPEVPSAAERAQEELSPPPSEPVVPEPAPEPPSPPPQPTPPPPIGKIVLSGISTDPNPILRVTGSFVLPAPDSLFEVPSGGSASIAGPLLQVQDSSDMVLGANALLAAGALTSTTAQALFGIDRSTVTIGGSLVVISSTGSLTAAGPLADLSSTVLTVAGGPVVLVEDGGSFDVTVNDAAPLLNLHTSVLSSAGSLLDLRNARIALAGPVVQLRQHSTLTNLAGPVLRLRDGSLVADSLISSDGVGNTLTLSGSLLDLTNATVTLRTPLSVPAGGSDRVLHLLAAGEPLIRLTDSSLTLTGSGLSLIQFGSQTGTPTTQPGVGLIARGSTLTTNGAVLTLAGVTLVDAMPQLQLTDTTVRQTGPNGLIEARGASSQVNGALLAASNSSISTTTSLLRLQDTTLTQATSSSPLLQFNQSSVTAADFLAEISGTLALPGPLVRATGSVLTTGGDFIIVGPGHRLTASGSQALVQLTDSSLRAFTLLFSDAGSVDLVGTPILNAVNSQLTFDFALVESEFGGRITSSSTAPLIALNGGTLTSNGHLFVLSGNVFDPTPELVAPLQTGGTLLEATNGTAIQVAGNALRLDTALLQATMPVFSLIGAPSQETVMTTGGSTVDLFKSSVTSMGPVVALDRGIINVTNGPLLRLADGSIMLVNGDLLRLLNGSKINVVNGPLILVTGNGSLLNVSGALVFFGGAGGNQIVVNNNIAPTATLSGIPVSATTGGSITIGPDPITNPDLGSLTVSPGGSAIQATNGGTVTIAAPDSPTN
ncbi:MAG TPA: FecR domain-containing protein [Alphaproteobacteria bacterium]|nr:FecR domain-containing protein [Alphaproteobacteria bacterium]